MADILEFIKPDTKFTPSEVIQEKITSLISELYQYKQLNAETDEEKEIIQSWRDELFMIRAAISKAFGD